MDSAKDETLCKLVTLVTEMYRQCSTVSMWSHIVVTCVAVWFLMPIVGEAVCVGGREYMGILYFLLDCAVS